MKRPGRTEKAAATRARIIAETIAVLDAGGDDAVKVQEIAAAAEVSTGSIYHHFDGRDGLVVAARLQQFRATLPGDLAVIERVVDNAVGVDEFRTAVSDIARVGHGTARSIQRRTRADVISAAHVHPALAHALADEQHRHAEAVAAVMARGQSRGLVDPVLDPHVLAVFLMALAFGMLLGDIDAHRPVDPTEWHSFIDRLIEVVLTGHVPPRTA
jgi:AcrR family transcriptional regulator